jgi:hypothetical protein
MPVEEKTPVSSYQTLRAEWVVRLLRLYPRTWRDRYGDEVAELLHNHQVTLWTALDIFLGALDAHAHPDLLPVLDDRIWRLSCASANCPHIIGGAARHSSQ